MDLANPNNITLSHIHTPNILSPSKPRSGGSRLAFDRFNPELVKTVFSPLPLPTKMIIPVRCFTCGKVQKIVASASLFLRRSFLHARGGELGLQWFSGPWFINVSLVYSSWQTHMEGNENARPGYNILFLCARVLEKNSTRVYGRLNNSLSDRDVAVANSRGCLNFCEFENCQFIEAGSIKHASNKEQFKVQYLSQIRL